jgi:hypothetical protein
LHDITVDVVMRRLDQDQLKALAPCFAQHSSAPV